jgi:2-keto-4-pentenoate hydratase/2-oxohepta-3-ene-1,7-dioic acid hydratase in catechol pathway
MRLISYRSAGEPRIGVRTDNGAVVDLHAASDGALPTDMVELLEGGDAAMAAVRDALARGGDDPALHAPADFELLPVVPRPPKIICVARNYGEHAAEANLDVLEQPNLFIRFAQSLLAAGDPIQVPVVSDKCDWEAELAVIIGKPGRHIAKADALDHVAGYAIFNDVSIRDWQLRKPPVQFGAGKNFDASGPFGPDLVTADEVPDPGALAIELRVNGEVMQASSTSQMIFDVPTLIEYISKFTTLEAGDVIATGTPSGVGHFRTPPRYLVAGDTVRIDLETIGVQESPVVDEEAAAA